MNKQLQKINNSFIIDKNKKGFAPKINAKRNVRKALTAATAITKESPIDKHTEKIPEPIATESSRASNIATNETTKTSSSTSIASVSTTTKGKEIAAQPANVDNEVSKVKKNVIATAKSKHLKATKAKPKAKPIGISDTQVQPISTPLEVNEEANASGLTAEEIEMNAIAARRRRNKKSISAPSPLAASFPPISAPSPMAPIIERSDCAHVVSNAPVLKIERITPGFDLSRKSMSRPLKIDEEEEDDTKQLAAAPVTSQPASPMHFDRSTTRETSMNIDIETDFDIPSHIVDATPPPELQSPSSSPSPQPVRASNRKNKGKAKNDGFFEPRQSTSTSTPVKKRAKARAAPSSSNGSTGISVPGSSSKVTPISIAIGAPSATPSEFDEEENDYDSDEYLRPARKGRKAGLKRKFGDKFAFRLPENLKTLDDISHDPARVGNLEKSMSTFTKDVDGIVSKHFKELELTRFAALKKLEAAANMTPEELEAMKVKEKEEEEISERKRQIAKEKEEERRKKETESSVLAES